MAKLFSLVVAVVFGISFVGLGIVQAKETLAGSAPIVIAKGKAGGKHGKAGDSHGKAGDHGQGSEHGQAGQDHGKAGDDHGKAGDAHGKKKGHDKKAH